MASFNFRRGHRANVLIEFHVWSALLVSFNSSANKDGNETSIYRQILCIIELFHFLALVLVPSLISDHADQNQSRIEDPRKHFVSNACEGWSVKLLLISYELHFMYADFGEKNFLFILIRFDSSKQIESDRVQSSSSVETATAKGAAVRSTSNRMYFDLFRLTLSTDRYFL